MVVIGAPPLDRSAFALGVDLQLQCRSSPRDLRSIGSCTSLALDTDSHLDQSLEMESQYFGQRRVLFRVLRFSSFLRLQEHPILLLILAPVVLSFAALSCSP